MLLRSIYKAVSSKIWIQLGKKLHSPGKYSIKILMQAFNVVVPFFSFPFVCVVYTGDIYPWLQFVIFSVCHPISLNTCWSALQDLIVLSLKARCIHCKLSWLVSLKIYQYLYFKKMEKLFKTSVIQCLFLVRLFCIFLLSGIKLGKG